MSSCSLSAMTLMNIINILSLTVSHSLDNFFSNSQKKLRDLLFR